MITFYRKKNPQTGVEDLHEVGTDRHIGPTEFGSGQGFQEKQTQPDIIRDGAGYKTKPTGSSLLESFQGQTSFVNTVKDLIQRKQKIQEPLTAQKAYWRTMQRSTAAPPEGDMFREMNPQQQAAIQAERYAAAGAHLQGIREEEEYRGTRIEDITKSITDMMTEKDKLAQSELDKTYKLLQIAKAKKELGLEPTAEDLGLDPSKGIGTKVGGTVSWRHNNPGNIKWGTFAKKYGATEGQKATDGGSFAVFPDVETGQRAMKELLQGLGYKDLTLEQAMKRWSGNGYGAEVWNKDYGTNIMSTITGPLLDELIQAMTTREGWKEGTELGVDSSGLVELSRLTGLSVAELETLAPEERALLKSATEEITKTEIKEETETISKQALYKQVDDLIKKELDKGTDVALIYSILIRSYSTKLSDSEIKSALSLSGINYDPVNNEWILTI